MALDFGSAGGFFGGAVSDLFAAKGYGIQAKGYDAAALHEDAAAKITAASTVIQKASAQRSIYKALGGQRSDIASSGFEFSGSAADIARDSAMQGSIAEGIIENQGAINVAGHQASAQSYRTQAEAARSAKKGAGIGGLLNIGLGVLSLFSDGNLKRNIKRVATDADGRNIYEYTYIGDDTRVYRGYIAQELEPEDVIDVAGVLGVGPKHQPELIDA